MPSLAKTLLASSAIALGLLAVLGSAQAQQSNSSAVAAAVRKIEVVPFNAASSTQVAAAADQQAETDVPAGGTADIRADASDAPAAAPPNASQDAPPAAAAALASIGTAPSRAEPKFITSDEAKRLNRQRYIERYEARYDSEPSYNERYVEPRYNERYVEPRYVEPRYTERYVEPRYVEPRYFAPQYVAPRHYVSHDSYAHRYQAAPNYGHTQRRVEYRSSRGY
jgi:hypothetical protein